MAKSANRRINVFINDEVANKSLQSIRKEVAKVTREITKNLVPGTADYNREVKKLGELKAVLSNHRNNLNRVEDSYKDIKKQSNGFKLSLKSIGGVVAGAFATGAVLQFGKQIFNAGVEMDTLSRKAETVLGESLSFVTAQAEDNAAAMGLTVGQYVSATTAIADLLIPMGFQREEASEISTELVNLSGALSEWSGGQRTATEVSAILNKALLGEREELKSLGISIMEVDVQNRLAANGMENLTGKALQQAKATATLQLITEKSVDAQTSFADNSDSLIRTQAELTARIATVAERLTVLLIPAMSSLLDIASGVADGIEAVSNSIVSIVDPAKEASKVFNDQKNQVQDLEKNFIPLIDRYDKLNKKTNRSNIEQKELDSIMQEITKTVPGAVTEFDKYGKALGISSDAARDFVKLQKKILISDNAVAIEENTKALAKAEENQQIYNNTLNGTAGGLRKIKREGADFFEIMATAGKRTGTTLRKLTQEEIGDLNTQLIKFSDQTEVLTAKLALLRGESIAPTGDDGSPPLSPTQEEIDAQRERAQKLREQREEENDEALKQFDKLKKDLEKLQENSDLKQLTKDEQEIERIRLKFQKQIDIAEELAKRQDDIGKNSASAVIALETARDAEIDAKLEERRKKKEKEEEEEEQKNLDFLGKMWKKEDEEQAKRDAELDEKKEEALQMTFEATLTENEKELETLRLHFEDLIEEAKKYGIDVEQLRDQQRDDLAALEKKQNADSIEEEKKTAKERFELQQKTIKATGELFGALGTLVVNTLDDQAKEQTGFLIFQRAITLAQIAVDTASAISSLTANSSANPFNAATFNAAGALQFTTGLVTILANVAKARQLLLTPIPQKFDGGFHDVTGGTDGKSYRANYLGRPSSSGLLPSGNQLILANERGPEYFVRHEDLKNPIVGHHVRMIENIRTGKQMQDGGFVDGSAPVEGSQAGSQVQSSSELIETQALLVLTIDRLNNSLDNGLFVRLDDQTLIDIQERLRLLEEVSGTS